MSKQCELISKRMSEWLSTLLGNSTVILLTEELPGFSLVLFLLINISSLSREVVVFFFTSSSSLVSVSLVASLCFSSHTSLLSRLFTIRRGSSSTASREQFFHFFLHLFFFSEAL